jgi:hypothetical protein
VRGRSFPMRAVDKAQSSDLLIPMLWGAVVIFTGAVLFSLLLYWLMKPTAYPNPGMAAYHPPPGTALLPPLRKMDSPEFAGIPAQPAQPIPSTQPTELGSSTEPKKPLRVSQSRARKGKKVMARRLDSEPKSAYATQWNRGFEQQSWFWAR